MKPVSAAGRRNAYSLVEVLISLLIFGAALIPVFHLISQSTVFTRFSKESVIASNLANELANQICSMRYAEVPVVGGVPLPNEADNAMLQEGKPGTRLRLTPMPERFIRELTIEIFSSRSKVIKAVVAWGNDPEHQVTITRIFDWAP